MIIIGCKTVSIRCNYMIGVNMTYIREGKMVEFLEGWINPTVELHLTPVERTTALYLAKQQVMDRITSQMTQCQDKERNWKGVTYG